MNKFSFVTTLSALALSQVSHAAIEVWARDRNGSTTPVQITGAVASGNHVTITPAALSAATGNSSGTEYIVWVFDTDATTTDPDESIGSITIDANAGFFGIMRVLVAPAPLSGATRSQPDFEASPATDIPPGAVNLGSVTITPSTYENAVAASIAVTGDVGSSTASPRDQVVAGQVYRLQANGRTVSGSLVGGNIYADVTGKTYASSPGQPYGSIAVGEVTAAKSIQGTINAPGFFDSNVRRAEIGSVRVTLATATDPGITGDIKAERGAITSIITTGKIGTSSTAKSQIRSGFGITQIRAIDGSGNALDRDFFADVKTNLAGEVDTFFLISRSLHLLQTGGDYVGTIDTDFLQAEPPSGDGPNWGIFVGGTFTGDIRIRHSVRDACIAAASFDGDIVIDHALEGAVVATGEAGEIPYLSVGRNPNSANTLAGFVGTHVDPQTLPFVPWELSTTGRQAARPAGPEEPDSVVSAASIGTITMSGMFRSADKFYAPRIESPEIGTLIIDNMREGVVWSGNIEYDLDGSGNIQFDANDRPILEEVQDYTDDYTAIGVLTLGCVSPAADLWFKQTATATVDNHLLGEFFLPTLASTEKIWIGQRLGTGTGTGADTCPCPTHLTPNDCALQTAFGWPPEGVDDSSPRAIGIADEGAIRIASATGLAGQVIINQDNTTDSAADLWSGQVVIGHGTGSPIVLSPASSSPDIAPYYTRTSTGIGGGAVGLAPFHLYETDCSPDHSVDGTADSITETDFNHPTANNRVLCRFYGPIKKGYPSSPWNVNVQVKMQPLPGPGIDECFWYDATSSFDIKGPGDSGYSDQRTISLGRKSGYHVSPGLYLVMPTVEGAVLCNDVTEFPSAVWPIACDYEAENEGRSGYVFKIVSDCTSDCDSNCPIADWNDSGTVTVQDIFDFLAGYFGGCIGPIPGSSTCTSPLPSGCLGDADVNNTCTITVQDIFDFLSAYFAVGINGQCP
ncbi:MAG: hypothetical protein IT438_15075 [Phycisphaerales bacterium]|nr:hypothetical protein [Phycisphaerales bacterium]